MVLQAEQQCSAQLCLPNDFATARSQHQWSCCNQCRSPGRCLVTNAALHVLRNSVFVAVQLSRSPRHTFMIAHSSAAAAAAAAAATSAVKSVLRAATGIQLRKTAWSV
jgi:hypothetical protein